MKDRVEIIEVSPRDGLQSDGAIVPTHDKVELITRAVDAGVGRIEAVSFAHPGRVPQMADAEDVMTRVPRRDGVSYIGLVLNDRGFERAVAVEVDEINVVVVITDTFSTKNQGMSTAEAVATWAAIADRAQAAGMRTSVTLSAAFGCPYEGEVPIERLVEQAKSVAEFGPDEIALADSIGVAAPTEVIERVAAVGDVVGDIALRGHFHNTRNTGQANVVAAVEAGVRVIDASLGGIGGCPFAPNATGNIATEDTVYLLDRMGYDTGIDLPRLIESVPWLEALLDHPAPGLLSKAGIFPPNTDGQDAPVPND